MNTDFNATCRLIRRILVLFMPLVIVADIAKAQPENSFATTNVSRLNILNPGFSYEFSVGSRQTILMDAGLATSFGIGFSSSQGTQAFVRFFPAFNAQFRYYYNGQKRMEKGKRTALNSQNYFAPVYSMLLSDNSIDDNAIPEEENSRPVSTIGLVWGLQRNYISRFSLDLNLGAGYIFARSTYYTEEGQFKSQIKWKPTILVNLQLGIWLNKRN